MEIRTILELLGELLEGLLGELLEGLLGNLTKIKGRVRKYPGDEVLDAKYQTSCIAKKGTHGSVLG